MENAIQAVTGMGWMVSGMVAGLSVFMLGVLIAMPIGCCAPNANFTLPIINRQCTGKSISDAVMAGGFLLAMVLLAIGVIVGGIYMLMSII
ncbi:hypothetical protein HQ571_05415 [Candidatus Kuenenbacteria bacterium]|nr:hypothetical protein [Candidatus Kuenenbacteria bacterium]